jgi:hypothetical protein
MAALAKQIRHIFERRMIKGRPGGQLSLDFSKNSSGGKIGFHENQV